MSSESVIIAFSGFHPDPRTFPSFGLDAAQTSLAFAGAGVGAGDFWVLAVGALVAVPSVRVGTPAILVLEWSWSSPRVCWILGGMVLLLYALAA